MKVSHKGKLRYWVEHQRWFPAVNNLYWTVETHVWDYFDHRRRMRIQRELRDYILDAWGSRCGVDIRDEFQDGHEYECALCDIWRMYDELTRFMNQFDEKEM